MEFFQTIWNALTTPNINMSNTITAFTIPIEATAIVYLFTILLNIPSTKKQKILYVVFASIGAFISRWFIPIPFRDLYQLTINIVANKINF